MRHTLFNSNFLHFIRCFLTPMANNYLGLQESLAAHNVGQGDPVVEPNFDSDFDSADDEAYQESLGDSTTSVSSEVKKGKFENGRRYASHGKHGGSNTTLVVSTIY